jgi:hypothetical protein
MDARGQPADGQDRVATRTLANRPVRLLAITSTGEAIGLVVRPGLEVAVQPSRIVVVVQDHESADGGASAGQQVYA